MSTLFKKVTSAISVGAVLASTVGTSIVAAASGFLPYAEALADAKIITMQSNEAGYRLADNALRQEVAGMMMSLNKAEYAANFSCAGKFVDISATKPNSWICKVVESALEKNLIAANTRFRPEDKITRAEALAMILKGQGIEIAAATSSSFNDVKEGWQVNVTETALSQKIISSNTSFNPNALITRGELFVMAANAAGLQIASDDLNLDDLFGDTGTGTTDTGATNTGTTDTGATNTGTTVVVKAGDLNVSLNPASPATGTQVPQAGIIRFAVVDFKAGSSDITLNTVELKKAALATIPSGTKVWFEKAGTRVSGKASFTSENNAIVSFAPALVVKANATESLDMYVEISATAGNDLQFASAAIDSSAANVTGSFVTPTLRTATYSVATATITGGVSGQSYNASTDAVELAKFTIVNTDTGSDTRDIKFQSVALYQSGSANLTNLSNVTVERNGVNVSTAFSVAGKVLSLTINDTIKDGATAIYTIKATINNVELTTDTYQLYLKNTSDISLTETATAFRATISSTVPEAAALYSVSGGDVKFERDTALALSQTVAPGTSDVVLMQGTITAKSAVTLEDVTINYTTTASGTTSMNTVYLKIGASTFTATPADSSTTTGSLAFLGSATVSGTATVTMYTKLKDGATGTIKVDDLSLAKFTTREYTSNQNTVASAIGTIGGRTITIGASTLNVTRTDGLGTTSLASGSKSVTVYGVKFSSTQGNEIALSNLAVVTDGDATSYTGGNTTLTLFVDGVAKSTKSVNTTAVSFDGFNATVSTTKSVDVVIKADFSDVTDSGSFNIASVSYDAVDNITSIAITPLATVAGATFNINTAVGTMAATSSSDVVNRSLLVAGAISQKLVSFKVTATNDNIKIKDIVITGANLDAVSNIRLTNSGMTVVGYASNVTATGATFANLDSNSSSSIATDKSATYFVVADINSSTNTTGVYVNVAYTGSDITSSNGAIIAMIGVDVAGAAHDVSENTFKITQGTPSSKNIATDAMEFTVNAFGKNNITLTGATFSSVVSGYDTGASVMTIMRKSDNVVVGTGVLGDISGTVSFTDTIDAGSASTYIVKIAGTLVDGDSTSQDWSVVMTSLNVDDLDAANYPKNTDTLPFTSTK